MMYGYDTIDHKEPMTGKQAYKTRKKFERLLQKWLDKGIIKAWNYNGSYHVTFNDTH